MVDIMRGSLLSNSFFVFVTAVANEGLDFLDAMLVFERVCVLFMRGAKFGHVDLAAEAFLSRGAP